MDTQNHQQHTSPVTITNFLEEIWALNNSLVFRRVLHKASASSPAVERWKCLKRYANTSIVWIQSAFEICLIQLLLNQTFAFLPSFAAGKLKKNRLETWAARASWPGKSQAGTSGLTTETLTQVSMTIYTYIIYTCLWQIWWIIIIGCLISLAVSWSIYPRLSKCLATMDRVTSLSGETRYHSCQQPCVMRAGPSLCFSMHMWMLHMTAISYQTWTNTKESRRTSRYFHDDMEGKNSPRDQSFRNPPSSMRLLMDIVHASWHLAGWPASGD